MAIENVQELLTEQLGKRRCDVITNAAMTGENYYCIQFVTDSVISSIKASNIKTGEASLHTTMLAGTTLFLNVTDITLASGLAIAYYDQPL
tara:strand:+ start:192 stop:464 length:273 start_codon:yes stop_codon:yes gene_type:complete